MSSTGHLVLNAPADPAKLAALLAQSLLPQIEQIVIQADRSLPPLRGPELKRQDPSVEETLTHAIDEMREFLLHLDSEAIEREQRIVGMLMQVRAKPTLKRHDWGPSLIQCRLGRRNSNSLSEMTGVTEIS